MSCPFRVKSDHLGIESLSFYGNSPAPRNTTPEGIRKTSSQKSPERLLTECNLVSASCPQRNISRSRCPTWNILVCADAALFFSPCIAVAEFDPAHLSSIPPQINMYSMPATHGRIRESSFRSSSGAENQGIFPVLNQRWCDVEELRSILRTSQASLAMKMTRRI